MKILIPFIGHNDDANNALCIFTKELNIYDNPQCIGIVSFDDYFPEFDCDMISFNENAELNEIAETLEDSPYGCDCLTYYPINKDYEHISSFLNEKQ
jgi:hypothetical protein